MRKIAVLLMCSLVLLLFSGCGSGNDGAQAAVEPAGQTQDANTVTIETKEDTSPAEVAGDPEDPEVKAAEGAEWANQLFSDTMQKLTDEGAVSLDSSEGFTFAFNQLDFGGSHELNPTSIFSTPELAKQYAAYPDLSEGKLIHGELGGSGSEIWVAYDYTNETPFYYPNCDSYPMEGGRIPRERFADSTEECDYLLLTVVQETERDEAYYMGNIDRVHKATLAMVIDAKNETLLYAETLYIDIPGAATSNPYGEGKNNLAEFRMISFVVPDEAAPDEEQIQAVLDMCDNPVAYSLCDMNCDGVDEILVMTDTDDGPAWSVYAKYYCDEYDRVAERIEAYEDDEICRDLWEGFYNVFLTSPGNDPSSPRQLNFDGGAVPYHHGRTDEITPVDFEVVRL